MNSPIPRQYPTAKAPACGGNGSALLDLEPGAALQAEGPISRDSAPFRQALAAHDRALVSIARRLCGNDADARDLVHDTYERALRSKTNYTNLGSLKSWLVTILHNLFVDRCRKARRTPRTENLESLEIPAPGPVSPPVWANMTAEHIARALTEISAEFRIVYERHAAGCPYDAIAAELGIPRATVRTRLARARKKLKHVLVRELEELA